MMTRPSWDLYFLQLAYLASTRGTCDRKKVGSVIVDPFHRVVSSGYNGAPAGQEDCDEVGHLMSNGSCVRSLHSESNALDYAGRFAHGCELFVTVTPCFDCSKRLINAGITKVTYHEFYSSRYGLSDTVDGYLKSAGIEVVHYSDSRLDMFVHKLRELDEIH